jgi:predicted transport protein
MGDKMVFKRYNYFLKSDYIVNNLVSFGNKRSYEDFIKQVPIQCCPIFDSIREYCISLGENVVEDIRMHRIVFGKSISFRWFADVSPNEDSIVIKIQKSRKEQPQIHEIFLEQKIDDVKKIIKDAFDTIH